MKLSTRARYALRMMTDVAARSDLGQPVQLKEIAGRQGISERYLGQIVISLKNNFILRGISGKNGGYMLSRPPEEILVGEVVEAAIGPINIVDCARDPAACDKSEVCETRDIFTLVNERIFETLNEFTIADLLRMKQEKDSGDGSGEDCSTCSRRDLCSSNFR